MNVKSFLAGAIFGVIVMLTLAAKNQRTPTWEYNVVTTNVYNDWNGHYVNALNKAAVDGWQIVASERRISVEPRQTAVEMVLKRSKE